MNEKKVKLLNLMTQKEQFAKLEYTKTSPTKIILTFLDQTLSAENDDLLETLIDIRKQLNIQDLDILVNGSRKNISSSPMIRQMSGGSQTYLIRLGVQAVDTVFLFDGISKEYLSSIEEQKEFHKIWRKSLAPYDGEIEEAKKHPNGNIYRFDRPFSKNEEVPPEAIIGAWTVDKHGKLTGEWTSNKNYIPREIREKDRKN